MSSTLESAQVRAVRLLRQSGIDTAALDARALLKAATGLTLEAIIANGREPLSASGEKRFEAYVARRLAGEPVARIRGTREFYGRDFRIDSNTLDPRPDTETVVSAAMDIVSGNGLSGRGLRILDLGTGSGCVLITLLAELPRATGLGTDINPDALTLARANAENLGIGDRAQFVAADWFSGLTGCYDLVISNPPYIVRAEIEGLQPEVARHDPRGALDGGPDGLDAYRRIAAEVGRYLRPGGALVLEIGYKQHEAVSDILSAQGLDFDGGTVHRDLAGLPRCVCARAPGDAKRLDAMRDNNMLGKS